MGGPMSPHRRRRLHSSLYYPSPVPRQRPPAERASIESRRLVSLSPPQSASARSPPSLCCCAPSPRPPTQESNKPVNGDLPATTRRRRPPHPRQGEASPRLQLPNTGRFPSFPHSPPLSIAFHWMIDGRLMGRWTLAPPELLPQATLLSLSGNSTPRSAPSPLSRSSQTHHLCSHCQMR